MTTQLSSLQCVAYGVGFRLAADSDAMLTKMLERAPLGTQLRDAETGEVKEFALLGIRGGSGYRLITGDEIVMEGGGLPHLLEHFSSELMVHVSDHAPDRVFVHAGVVGWQGKALVLPGASFAGKSTLVAELVRAGATYYSDEYAVLDERGWVHTYARDLRMRTPGGREQGALPVEDLRGCAGDGPLPVAQVVFTEYVASGRWRPEPVSAGMAALEMLRHAIPVRRTPVRVMATLAKVMETATAWRSQRGEAAEAASAMLSAMSAGSGATAGGRE
jgi:hypothetical protein